MLRWTSEIDATICSADSRRHELTVTDTTNIHRAHS
jgi:hypothetical protein